MALHRFTPKNLQKYRGDASKITARSSWELMYMSILDSSPQVKMWTSEPNLHIRYYNPISRKEKNYFPDFLIHYTNGTVEIVEIKPAKEALISAARSQYDKLMLIQNMAKWQRANELAKRIGATFRVVTENQLFPNGRAPTQRKVSSK